MENNFDLKKFLVENKLTYNSRVEENTTEDSELDAAMKAGLSTLSSGEASLEKLTDKEQPKELNESAVFLIGSALLAAPKVIEWLAKAVGTISKFYSTEDNPDDPAFIKKITHFAHKWEKLYLNVIIWGVKKTEFAKTLWTTQDNQVDEQKLVALAKILYAIILALAIGKAVGTILEPGSAILKSIEASLGGVKATEIAQIISKVKGQLT
jgi:hypothetical protein